MKLLFTVFSLLLGFVPINASSTVILERYKDTNEMTIRIVGEIKLKEYSEFVKVYKSLKKSKFKLHLNAIQLDSPGGNRRAGIDIGWFISSAEFSDDFEKRAETLSKKHGKELHVISGSEFAAMVVDYSVPQAARP